MNSKGTQCSCQLSTESFLGLPAQGNFKQRVTSLSFVAASCLCSTTQRQQLQRHFCLGSVRFFNRSLCFYGGKLLCSSSSRLRPSLVSVVTGRQISALFNPKRDTGQCNRYIFSALPSPLRVLLSLNKHILIGLHRLALYFVCMF